MRLGGWEGVFKMQNEKWKNIIRRDETEKKISRRNTTRDDGDGQQLELWGEK